MVGWINHSCNPNCRVEPWVIAGFYRLVVFAERDISAMEELTFDYNTDVPENTPKEDRGDKDSDMVDCLCGSKICRKPRFKRRTKPTRQTKPARQTKPTRQTKPIRQTKPARQTESTWCICGGKDDGDWMVMCNEDRCKYQWFHFRCVGLTAEPERETWFCSTCAHFHFCSDCD